MDHFLYSRVHFLCCYKECLFKIFVSVKLTLLFFLFSEILILLKFLARSLTDDSRGAVQCENRRTDDRDA